MSNILKFDFKRMRTVILLVLLDVLAVAFAFFGAVILSYSPKYIEVGLIKYFYFMLMWVPVCLAVFFIMRLYNNILVFASTDILFRVVMSYTVLALVLVGLLFITPSDHQFRSKYTFYAIGMFLSFIFTLTVHFSRRILAALRSIFSRNRDKNGEKVMVIGAGVSGRAILREFAENKELSSKAVCFIDDNPSKKGCHLEGVPIVGGREEIMSAAEKYSVDKIVLAIPSCKAADKKEILEICGKTDCAVEVIPGFYHSVNGHFTAGKRRNVEIEDLLGRDPVEVNLDEIYEYISGKVVMVTGGGGSIGSELCRQIAISAPKQLIIFDIYENNAYDIQLELKRKYPYLDLVVLIGSVRNTARLDRVLGRYKPDIVFHAAAHKHVPLMEDSPNEAIKNNVFGTYKMAKAAVKYGVKKFVLISTDKAVNPTNIMGASKRLCEMVVQMMKRKAPNTEFVAVRFGNVLGSNGSVIPLFKKQIAEGGPVTVTHPEITRFFMTIPEAVSLVLQAGYYANGGEIYVLDMGKPMRIADLARNLIRLMGYEPDGDIKIEYTGLRPGEKLYEELLMDEEGLQETENKLIHIGQPIEMDDELFEEQLARLEEAYKIETEDMKDIVAEIVPTYKRDGK